MVAVVLCVIFAQILTVSAIDIKTCCVPRIFQSVMDVNGGKVVSGTNHTEFYDRRVHLYFDYERQMTRTDTNVTLTNGMTFTHTEIVDYHKKKTYKIDAGRCSKEDLTVNIQDQCITSDAQLVYKGFVGSPENGVELVVWKYKIPVTNVTIVRAVTAHECWPVYQMEYGIFEGGYTSMSYITGDVNTHPFQKSVMTHPGHCHW